MGARNNDDPDLSMGEAAGGRRERGAPRKEPEWKEEEKARERGESDVHHTRSISSN